MFETDPILWLQENAGEGLVGLALAYNSLGYRLVIWALAWAVMWGIDFRRGALLIEAICWNQWATGLLKQAFALPRPAEVDRTVRVLDGAAAADALEAGGAQRFWSPLPADVVEHFRRQGSVNWGLPSGHTSAIAALWGGLAALFRRRWLWLLALGLPTLMGLTRMLMGRHFLADVLAGTLLGWAAALLAWVLWTATERADRSTAAGRALQLGRTLVPIVLIAAGLDDSHALAQLVGLRLACRFVAVDALRRAETWAVRVAQVALAELVYLGLWSLGVGLSQVLSTGRWGRTACEILSTAAAVWLVSRLLQAVPRPGPRATT